MKQKWIWNKNLVIVFAILISLGCGGGGGGGTTPSTIRTFHLNDDGVFDPGYSISFSLTGTSSAGENLVGKTSFATRNVTILDGNSVIPQEQLIELKDINTGAFASSIATKYLDETTHEPIKWIDHTSGIEYTPTKISELPEIAEIGEFGSLTSYVGSDGTTYTKTWSLEDAGNNLADLITIRTTKLSNGDIKAVTEYIRTIDETGDTQALEIEIYYPNTGLLVNLSGSRIN